MNATTITARLVWAKRALDQLPAGRMRSIALSKLEAALIYAVAASYGYEDLFTASGEQSVEKPSLTGALKARTYDLLREAIEEGLRAGYRRAHKHSDKPAEESTLEHQEREVLAAIFERFDTE